MKQEVALAIEELRRCFPDAEVQARANDDGGASVTIDSIDLGPAYHPGQTWIKFDISFQYPYADVYPVFVRPDLVRLDGLPHGEGISKSTYENVKALQLSRRNNHLDPNVDTAALKIIKVIEWLRAK